MVSALCCATVALSLVLVSCSRDCLVALCRKGELACEVTQPGVMPAECGFPVRFVKFAATRWTSESMYNQDYELTLNDTKGLSAVILILKNMGIARIEEQAFTSIKTISHLDLSENRLSTLEPQTFSGLDRLMSINLALNLFEHVPDAVHSVGSHLITLNLLGNRLKRLEDSDLVGMRNLKRLDLSFNRLHSMAEASLDSLVNLQSLAMSGNRFPCDCDLTRLYSFAQECLCVFSFGKCIQASPQQKSKIADFVSQNCEPHPIQCTEASTKCTFSDFRGNTSQDNGYFLDTLLKSSSDDNVDLLPFWKMPERDDTNQSATGSLITSLGIFAILCASIILPMVIVRKKRVRRHLKKRNSRKTLISEDPQTSYITSREGSRENSLVAQV